MTHEKKGYLNENFQLFHLRDQLAKPFDFHYHEFNKIVVFLSGKATYIIEGKAYFLKPWDILLVNHYAIHKPVIDPSVPYERMVIYVKEEYIEALKEEDCDISACFRKANDRSFSLIRLDPKLQEQMRHSIHDLESSLQSEAFGSALLSRAIFTQFMIYVNRIFLDKLYIKDKKALHIDSHMEDLLTYIHNNLSEDLSVETLSAKCFLSKYYLMHKFKEDTGCTLHKYITQKRLLAANALIAHNTPVTKAATMSGFGDYTTFSRAYKKMFGHSPKQEHQKMGRAELLD
ncbi:MAG: AraC family transcriptional regulator [Lachnospiraceae bacterium]|nr:AraC family transcriptional regulator [Lachnospiraceae bacterium]